MKIVTASIWLLVAAAGLHANDAAAPTVFGFEKDRAGQPPVGFSSLVAGSGKAGKWVVAPMPDAPGGKLAVQQTDATGSGKHYPILIADEGDYSDLDLSVQGKPLSGEEDQVVGLVFRYRDPKNFYVVRANVLEENVRLYKMVDGQRVQFAGVDVKVAPRQWHLLRVVAKGGHFACHLNGKLLFEADDATYASGKIGLWTKADSVTAFDELQAKSLAVATK